MSSFAFSFSATPKDWPASAGVWTGSAEQLKKFNAPSPCKWNDACVYSKCCGFVHAGEEGTGLKFFPGRTVTGTDGKQFWEQPCVRLIGSPRFYERRRLHLSWPAWCEREGLAAPVPLCERSAPVPDRKERIALLPTPVASVLSSGAIAPPPPAAPSPALAQAMQAQLQWYQQIAAWQQFFFQQQQQAAIARLPAWRQPGISVMTAKNAIGEQIYLLAKARMDASAADRATLGLAHPSITPGKITGMLLDAHDIDTLERLLTDDAEFSRNLWQGVHVLAAAAAGQDTERAAEAADAEWTARAH
jgi:hypothetical protein